MILFFPKNSGTSMSTRPPGLLKEYLRTAQRMREEEWRSGDRGNEGHCYIFVRKMKGTSVRLAVVVVV